MKKNLVIMSALALSALFATSCTKQNDDVQVGGEATVVLTAQLPSDIQNNNGPRRKAAVYGDGKTATTLDYAVYQVNATSGAWTKMDDFCKTGETINLSTTVKLQLVNGNTYAVIFWADAATSIYSFDMDAMTVTADYSAATAGNEAYDAFYAVKTITVNGAMQETVELKRPFAQLNIGTADLAAATTAGVTVTKAGIKVNTYKTLNLKSGEVSDPADVEFALAALPTGETFPVAGYDYLTMNYLLMPVDKKADNTITISYDNTTASTRTFNNVPLQRNYRTNIYGNLLTSSTEFNVVITPGFDGNEPVYVWDGTTTIEPQKDANGNYLISNAAEWAWLAKQTNLYTNVYVTEDIDFQGHEVMSISIYGGKVFDGQNHTFSNLVLKNNELGDEKNAGLFGYATSATIKNLTVRKVKVISDYKDDASRAGVIIGGMQAPLTLDNIHVIDAEISGVQSVGGLVGFSTESYELTITNCSVDSATITNRSVANESGYVAGLVGRACGTNNTISNCKVSNTTITAYYATRRGEASIQPAIGVNSGSTVNATDIDASNNVIINKTVIMDITVTSTEELNAAIAAGKSAISLAAGNYTINGSTGLSGDKTVTLIGEDKATTILTLAEELTQEGIKLSFSNITLSSVATGNYDLMFVRATELNFTNCDINGVLRTTATKTVVDNCTIDNPNAKSGMTGYPIWLYANNMIIKNSTIKGNTKGILVYNEGAYKEFNLTVENCKFINKTTADDKAAIEIHSEYGIYGTLTINGTTIENFPTSVGAGAGLWNEVNNNTGDATKKFTVTVDGTTVQTAE